MINPQMCGGQSQSINDNAPKTISSDKMVLFKASSSLRTIVDPEPQAENHWINHISAFAAPVDDGVFLVLSADDLRSRKEFSWAFVREDIFPKLAALVKEANLASCNGRQSFTYGLPENFGGEVLIGYDSGEKIEYSNNQSPVFGKDFAAALYGIFTNALKAERAELPSAESITSVTFFQKSGASGFTRAELAPKPDGSFNLKKEYKFEDPQISEYNFSVSAEILQKIKNTAQNNAVLIWNKLPKSDFDSVIEKSLTFTLDSGEEIVIKNDRVLPYGISGAFYAIESELMALRSN